MNGIVNTFFNTSTIDKKAVIGYNNEIEKAIANNVTMAEKQEIMQSAMNGTNKVTAQLIGSTKGAIVGTEALAEAQRMSTLSAKAGQIALKGLAITGNMIAAWAIIKGIELLAKGFDNLIHHSEKLKEALDDSVSSFDSISTEVSDLKKELADCTDRMSELQKSADAGTISVIEKDELDTLKKTNTELERKLALKQADMIQDQQKVLEANGKVLNDVILSHYKVAETGNHYDPDNPDLTLKVASGVTVPEELGYAIDRFDELNNALKEGTISQSEYDKQIATVNEDIITYIGTINTSVEAYDKLIESGLELQGAELAEYELLKGLQDRYLAYNYAINQTAESYRALSEEQKKNIILDRLKEQGLSENEAKAVYNQLDSDQKDAFYEIAFTFKEPDRSDYDSAYEYGKAYAEAMFTGVNEALSSSAPAFDFSLYKEKVSDFRSQIKTLGDTLFSIRSGDYESTEFSELLDEFPTLADRTEDLDVAIEHLIQDSLDELIGTLGEDAPAGLVNSLKELANAALGTSVSVKDAFSSIQSSYEVLNNFKDAMESGFDSSVTDDLLSSVAGLSGNLNTMVAGFYAGVVSADELYEALFQHYQKDLQNYGKALVAKNETNTEFYNNIGMANADIVNQFSKDYGVDLSNCKTYAQAKYEIEMQTLKKISSEWSKYYNAQTRSFTSSMFELEQVARSSPNSPAAKQARALIEQIKQEVFNYEAAMDKLDDVTYNGLSSYFDKISTRLSSNDSASSDTYDWIETLISRIERSITKLGSVADSVYKTWSTRNKNLKSEISEVKKEIDLQQQAYNRYMKQANSVGLSSSWAKKVRDGKVDIETITNESLADKIQEYQEWYEKALDCKDAIDELNETVSELYQTAFDNIVSEYDNLLSSIENRKNLLDGAISQTEERGYIVSIKYYQSLISAEQENIVKMQQERSALLASLNNAVSSGAIKEYSSAWYDMRGQIDDVALSIEEANTALIEYGNSIRDIQWEIFDLLQERISNVANESDFLINLMENAKLYDDRGQLTDKGMSTMGLHGMNYNVYMSQADKYAEELLRISQDLANDPYNQDLVERRQELLELQQESILNAEEEKQAIVDMVENGIEKELDALKELIDTYEEALDSRKDLFDYQKQLAEQTEAIDSLEKQRLAYANDDSEENRARLQEINTQLKEARADLEETEYDRYISDQKQLLDSLYTEYESVLNARLDDIDLLIADMIEGINTNAEVISDTLTQTATDVGYVMTDEMNTIWGLASDQLNADITSLTDVLTVYGTDFQDKLTTTNATLNSISISISDMLLKLDREAAKSSGVNSFNTGSSGSGSSTASGKGAGTGSIGGSGSVSGSGDKSGSSYSNTKNRTDKEYYGVALAAWNGNYGWGAGDARAKRLKEKGFDSARIQSIINQMEKDGYIYSGSWVGRYKGITTLEPYRYNKFQHGARKINKDQMAWTQEGNVPELIMYPDGSIGYPDGSIKDSNGALFTPVPQGSSILNGTATKNLFDFANYPEEFIRKNSGANLPASMSSPQNNYIQHIGQVVFDMPNVKNYEELLSSLARDKRFSNLINAMSVDVVAGKSQLRKYHI